MKNYLINASAYVPYKREFSYRESGSSMPVAVTRAMRKFVKEDYIKGKKQLGEVTIKVVKL